METRFHSRILVMLLVVVAFAVLFAPLRNWILASVGLQEPVAVTLPKLIARSGTNL